jgi:hypothetical protein
MSNLRHLGQPPLPPGEGWGEGTDWEMLQYYADLILHH